VSVRAHVWTAGVLLVWAISIDLTGARNERTAMCSTASRRSHVRSKRSGYDHASGSRFELSFLSTLRCCLR
jgi:hypothetical protein